ncbi:MAG: HEAT repeat domain-containing protein, partial [Planctomycetes bacterium]|nr:HEAT repeat domain-containing protein [Planctomycetota bacterium]
MRLRPWRVGVLLLVAAGCLRRGPAPIPPSSLSPGTTPPLPARSDPASDPVPSIEQELRQGDPARQEQAAVALWSLGTSTAGEAIDRLLRQAEDDRVRVLLSAARNRRHLRFPESLTHLIHKGDPALFPLLLEALPSFEPEGSASSLIALLRDVPLGNDAKRRAIAALGATRSPKAAHALIARLTTSKPGFLTRPGERDPLDEETLSALDRLTGWHFSTAEEWSRWWERHASESREEWLEQALIAHRAAQPPEEDMALRRELVLLKNSQFELLLDRAASTRNAAEVRRRVGAALIDPYAEHRVAAIEMCRRLDPALAVECLHPLVEATHDKDERVRAAAIAQIGALSLEDGVPALRAAVGDVRASVRAAAVTALGKFAGPESAAALIERLGDADARVVAAAAESLGKIKSSAAAGPLLPLCDSSTDAVRRAAIFALGEIGDPRAVDPLLAALRHADPQTRWWSANALGKLSDPRAIPALREALNDSTAAVRLGALDAIARLAGPEATSACADALARDADDAVRLRAAQRLGEIGDAPAVGALVAAVASANERVSATARSALQQVATGTAEKAAISVSAALESNQPRLAHDLFARIGERHLFLSDSDRTLLDPLRVRTGQALAGTREWKPAQP